MTNLDLQSLLAGTGFATSDITDRIRADILAGAFSAGQRIKIAELAERYSVSSMPIREALRTLDGEGLLTIIPNKGAKVRSVDKDFVRNLYEIRAALESLLIERACQSMTLESLKSIEAIEARLEEAAARNDANAVLAANAEFHKTINALGRNPEAVRLLRIGENLIVAFRRQFGFQPARLNSIAAEHRALIEALWNREVARSISITRMHTNSACNDLISCLED